MSRKAKSGLRKKYLILRKKFHPSDLKSRNSRIVENLAGILGSTRFHGLCLYKPVGNEPDPGPLAKSFFGRGIFYPVVRPGGLEFHGPGTGFRRSSFGIPEPRDSRVVLGKKTFSGPNKVVVFLVPGVVFDTRGGRIGFGKGYYDAFFRGNINDTDFRIIRVGVAWDFQVRRALLPLDGSADVRMDMIVTERNVYRPRLRG